MDIHHDLQVPREGQPEPTVSALAAYAAGLREALEGLRAEVDGHNSTMWCAECFEWWVRESEQDCIRQLREDLTAAQSGEARAVEELEEFRLIARAACDSIWASSYSFTDEEQALFDWIDLAEIKADSNPAVAWLAQREANATEAERSANTDVIRSLGPDFCGFFFGGPGAAEYLAGVLRAQRAEAAAEELEGLAERWCCDDRYDCTFHDLWRLVSDRVNALRAGATGETL
jgi:hypothetical protein